MAAADIALPLVMGSDAIIKIDVSAKTIVTIEILRMPGNGISLIDL